MQVRARNIEAVEFAALKVNNTWLFELTGHVRPADHEATTINSVSWSCPESTNPTSEEPGPVHQEIAATVGGAPMGVDVYPRAPSR